MISLLIPSLEEQQKNRYILQTTR
nr:hypothetical protein [Lactococcus lactis]